MDFQPVAELFPQSGMRLAFVGSSKHVENMEDV